MEKRIFELIEIIDNEIQYSNASMVQAVNIGKYIDELKAKLRLVKKLNIDDVSKRLYGVYCTYEDDELISVHKTEKGAIKNKEAQTNYQQNYYHTDFVLLWD